jgi:hypothetical protein
MTVTLKICTQKDQDELVRHMRTQDIEEMALIPRLCPADAVLYSVAISSVCFAMRIEHGPLLCIFGAAVAPIIQGEASIWELGTTAIDSHRTAFMRHCRPALRLVMDALPEVDTFFNFIPETNLRSMRWLETLGARFNARTISQHGVQIRGFVIDREKAHV